MHTKLLPLLAVAVFGLSACAPTTTKADAITLPVKPDASKNLRDVRYCEVLPVYRNGSQLVAEVFNTIGLNDCPAELWDKLDAEALKREFGAVAVELNGPRAWAMDEIVSMNASANSKQATFGGIAMLQVATLSLSPAAVQTGQAPLYQEQAINRTTRYLYRSGRAVRELVSSEKKVYVMQTYDLKAISDPKQLSTLGARLKLPPGWSYRERILESDLELAVSGQATVTRDDLQNTYQYAPQLRP